MLYRLRHGVALGRSEPLDLQSLLIAAAESPPEQRGRWVEPLAAHGAAALERVADWVYDDDLAAFAFDVIVRAAELGAVAEAWSLLKDVERRQLERGAFARLVRATDRVDALPRSDPVVSPETAPQQLITGHIYRRRVLHAAGLGADLFHGISYPAKGGPVLLFSGGHGKDFGYRDGWDHGIYRYYGEWRGEGDMRMTGGNAAIRDRSPNLYLFTVHKRALYRFEGRFECVGHTWEPTEREGTIRQAIVFQLRRVADVVDVIADDHGS